ncbi:MAG: cupin [Cyanobacteria bacterium RYN_339]|nr:cupin [Cyanobacteria bacterium RYN_339]
MTAQELITRLGLEPHPEGGAFRETYRSARALGDRALATGIYFLLAAGERSEWHRVAGDELWLYHGGDPLWLRRVDATGGFQAELLGLDVGALPQRLVPGGEWQSAQGAGGAFGWTLVGCVVAPGFDFQDFELADLARMQALFPELASLLEFHV